MTDVAAPAEVTLGSRLDPYVRSWRGPLLAGLIAMIAGLPGLFGMAPLDRDESRFAQATAQMLETGDYVNIAFQDEPRHKKPVGIHWLQAASVAAFSSAEAREIQPYRLPSLLAAMVAAWACAWGAGRLFDHRTGFIAGAIFGCTFLLSTEAFIAKTDATLCAAVTVAMAALARLYVIARESPPRKGANRRTKIAFWTAIAVMLLVKGPVGPLVVGLTILALVIFDRNAAWVRRLGWSWGLVWVAALVGPWAVAITVVTDGAFWGTAIGGDLAPKITGGQERHGAPPGLHTLLSPLLFFPATLLLPAALVEGWRRRKEPAVRFAIAWLLPAWIMFELAPTKLWHYTLPTFGALCWLAAAAVARPLGPRVRWAGIALSLVAAAAVVAVAIYALAEFGDPSDETWAALAAGLAIAAALVGGWLMAQRAQLAAVAAACGLGLLCHGVLVGALLPSLQPLNVSSRLAEALADSNLDPRGGVTPGPVALAGYAEPSAIFLLGTRTEIGNGDTAAAAVAEGRPAFVDATHESQFRAALAREGASARAVTTVEGLNYSRGDPVRLTLYARAEPRP